LFLCVSAAAPAQDSRPAPDRAELLRKAQEAWDARNWEETVTRYQALLKVDAGNGVAWHHLGYALHVLNRLDEALAAHLKTAEFPRIASRGLYNAGCVYALKKDKDKAFEYLSKAAAAGFDDVDALKKDEDLVGLHDDPRWEKLAAEVAAAVGPAQVFANNGDRKASRVVWFSGRGAPQAIVSYGPVAWKDAYAEQIKSTKLENTRWRLGKDFWTTLETSLPLAVGGKDVAPGYYYLTLERRTGGDFVLAINDAEPIRKARLDAFQADKTKGGIEVVLKHETLSEPAAKLEIGLTVEPGDQGKGALTIRFGPNKLTAPVVYQTAQN
jgi:tetratricopeptide (TPR) repeat protein